MEDAEKLLRNWRQSPPRDAVKCADGLKVMAFLEMGVKGNNEGHYEASYPALLGSLQFPYGGFTMNCHAFGMPGKAHPAAIKDLLKAAKIIQDSQKEEEAEDADDTE